MSDGDNDNDNDNDNDGIQDSEERTDWFGNHVVEVNGEQLTEMHDVFGNTVFVDDHREVEATIEPDGDIRMENGPTYTNVDDHSGWADYRGSDGSVLTILEDTAGFASIHTSNKSVDSSQGPVEANPSKEGGNREYTSELEADYYSKKSVDTKSDYKPVFLEKEVIVPIEQTIMSVLKFLGF